MDNRFGYMSTAKITRHDIEKKIHADDSGVLYRKNVDKEDGYDWQWGWDQENPKTEDRKPDTHRDMWVNLLRLMDDLGAESFDVTVGYKNPTEISWGTNASMWISVDGRFRGVPLFVYSLNGKPVAVKGQTKLIGGSVYMDGNGNIIFKERWGMWK